jgi:DNA-binding IclR family transcriptional regulator
MRISSSTPKRKSKQRARSDLPEKVAGTQSIRRAMEILREFATADARGLRVVDLCERLQLGWPTVHRILLCLVQERMLMQATDAKRYRLGPAVFQLGLAATPHFSLRELCAEALERLAHKAGDTVFLTTRSACDSVVIDRKEGGFEIKALPLEVGARRPRGVGAGGLAILAALQDGEVRRIMKVNAGRLASHSDLDAASLMAMVLDSRARGFALNRGHAFPDVTGIGLPIMTRSGVPIAAISIVAIGARMTDERIASDVKLMREEIEQLEARLATSEI